MKQQSIKSNNLQEKSKDLEKLRLKLFAGITDNDTEQTRILIQIMREVGGYSELMNMTLPAIKEVYDFLKWENKEIEKKMPKFRRK